MAFLGQEDQVREYQERFRYLYLILGFCFLLLASRMLYLQVLQGDKMRQFSEENRIKKVKIASPRGMVFDRNHTLLLDNRPSYDLEIVPQYLKESKVAEAVIEKLNFLLKFKPDAIRLQLDRARGQPTFLPIKIKEDLSREEVAIIETWKTDLPGVQVQQEIKRTNLFRDIASHLLGYIGEITPKELQRVNQDETQNKNATAQKIPYKNGDRIGKSGLEKTMESELRGIDGEKWLEVDALGRMKLENKRGHLNGDQAFEKPAVPGKNLTLTIDQDLQVIAAEAFGDKAGALVAINPESGEILAMISRPSYDPSAFARGIPTGLWNQLLKNENKPLRDKTIQDHYPPGSVFKLVTAITGLEEGVIDENSEFSCAGSIRMGNQVRHCHKKQGHGAMNVINAIIQSCDVFFYRVGQKLKSVDQIATWAQHLGLGKKTGVALNHEVPGLIPSEAWKLKVQKQPWQDGETLSVAIGQGPVLTTVLQLANMYASIANGGSLYRPYLIQSVTGNDSEVYKKYEAELMDQTRLKPKTYELIKKGLWGVVNSPHGTAYSQRLLGMDMAGKTGTAQVIGISADKIYNKCENMRYIDRHHGLFAAFAPVEKPRIAIAVIVEHACHGASAAAPIAKAVIKKYLQKYYPQEFSDEVLKLKNITPAQLARLKNKETLPPLTIEDEETTSPDSLTPGMLKVSPAPEQHESPEPEQDDNSNE